MQNRENYLEKGGVVEKKVFCICQERNRPWPIRRREYDNVITVADASGNSTEVSVHIVVGDAPEFSDIEDITVTADTEEVDYLDGVTAKDSNGNDITADIVCDSS